MSCHPLSDAEARQVVELVKPVFSGFLAKYDVKKYPPDVYLRACQEFSQPSRVVSAFTIRDALLWKWGHLGKPRIPAAHTSLISEVQKKWPALACEMSQQPEQSFLAPVGAFGGKTRFITVAFLTHLLHPHVLPIIDQHNFRAINGFAAAVRPAWKTKKKPSAYRDIEVVMAFMEAVRREWHWRWPESVPTVSDLDKFLMMYGKAIKAAPGL